LERINLEYCLEKLENDFWDDSDLDENGTSLVTKVYALRKIPLNKLKPEQIILLIGQDLGIDFILPLALNILDDNPFIECTFYPCDLLKYISKIKIDY
jgi:hypothetical protein